MKRVSLFLIIAVIIAALGCGGKGNDSKESTDWVAEAYTGAAKNIDYEKIYQPIIEKLKSEYKGTRAYYAFYDIDNNNIPELLFMISISDGDIISDIYTIKEGSPALLFNPPSDRYGSSKILRNGLITDPLGYSIYKISADGISITKIGYAQAYDYPDEASRALAKWRYYINDSEVDHDYYVQHLKQQGYRVGGRNIEANIDWKDVVEGFTGGATAMLPHPESVISVVKMPADFRVEYHFFADEQTNETILFLATESVENFAYIEIIFAEDSEGNFVLLAGELLFGLDVFTPEKPFVVTVYIGSAIPTRAIHYEYNGMVKYFLITESGMDGSLMLIEFTPFFG